MTVSVTRVETDNDVVITDATSSLNALSTLTDAHNDWGWKEVSSTLAPGLYRLDVADAAFAAGALYAVIYVMITTGEAAAVPKAFRLMTYTEVIDALLCRDWTAITLTPADRSVLQALRLLRNKWDIALGVLTVKKEDDTTTAWTSVLTGAPGADPVSGSDPT
jgi:hypothetical protein